MVKNNLSKLIMIQMITVQDMRLTQDVSARTDDDQTKCDSCVLAPEASPRALS